MGKWKRLFTMVMILLFLTGLFLLLYPYLYGGLTEIRILGTAEEFLSRVDLPVFVQPEGVRVPADTVPAEVGNGTVVRTYPELWADMCVYNDTIYRNAQMGLSCEAAYEVPSFILKDYGLVSEAFGVLSIPILEFSMPIYLGATDRHMSDGVAHLSQTSLPIGGKNTNAVLAGHRGWYGADFLRYIEKLNIGDEVIVTNLWETLCYEVCEIRIIEPTQVEAILIQPDRELLTLLTCHPYASGGRQRYLVICERTK